VEKTNKKIDTACEFTSQLLTRGNSAEILYLKPVVSSQLLNIDAQIRSNYQTGDLTFDLVLEPVISAFEKSVQVGFYDNSKSNLNRSTGVKYVT